jgi:lysyl-tRNA synthetase class I
MAILHHLPDKVVHADPWTLYCAECAQVMRIRTATPAQGRMERRTYECTCGHRETLDVALH